MNNKRLKGVIALISICFFVVSLIQPTQVFAYADSKISDKAREHILGELEKARIPNAAIAILQEDEISYIFKDSTQDTLFEIGSVSKSFTAFGVLLLEDKGKLSVDDPVNKHLPWFEVNYQGVSVPHEDITIRNLLNHTSGFTSHEGHFAPVHDLITTDELIRQIIGSNLAFYPSEEFAYGNINYVLLGFIIEAVSGLSYDEYMKQNVLKPLDLHSTFTSRERAHETGLVIGGNRLGFLRIWSREVKFSDFIVPTGNIYSSIADMGRWAQIQLGLVDIDEQFRKVVKRSHSLKPSNEALFDSLIESMGGFYAAGWGVETNNEDINHAGMTTGYTAVVHMLPKRNTAVVFLNNLTHAPVDFIPDFVLETIEDGSFNTLPTAIFAIMDLIYTILTIVGIIVTGVFIWYAFRLAKKLQSGYKIKCKFSFKNIMLLFLPLALLTVTIGWNALLCITFGNKFTFIVLYSPLSYVYANISMVAMAVYALCFWWAKIFIQPKYPKDKQ